MAVNTFSIAADVMTAEVNNSIQTSLSSCNSSLAHCHVVLQYKLTYRGGWDRRETTGCVPTCVIVNLIQGRD